MAELYQLCCRECGKFWGNTPKSFCEECFSPLEVAFGLRCAKKGRQQGRAFPTLLNMCVTRNFFLCPKISARPMPLAEHHSSPRAIWRKNSAYKISMSKMTPSASLLFLQDRVVATALVAARRFEFKTVGCSSTGNLANAVAAQSAQQGFDACVFIPADLEPAKFSTLLFTARASSASTVTTITSIASAPRSPIDSSGASSTSTLRPYYAEGSKTHGYEIAEQTRLGTSGQCRRANGRWRSLITKIAKAFRELVLLGWVKEKPVKFFGAQATGCSPISDGVKRNLTRFEPQKPQTIARSLAIGNPADGPYAMKEMRDSGGLGGRRFRSRNCRRHSTARRNRRHFRRNCPPASPSVSRKN